MWVGNGVVVGVSLGCEEKGHGGHEKNILFGEVYTVYVHYFKGIRQGALRATDSGIQCNEPTSSFKFHSFNLLRCYLLKVASLAVGSSRLSKDTPG